MAQSRPPTSKDLVITCVKGEGTILKFWALPLNALETLKSFENYFLQNRNKLDQTSGFLSSNQTPVGFKGAVFSQIKKTWCRARVLHVIGFSDVVVQLIDYGNEETVSVVDIRSLEDEVLRISPQAVECILADVVPTYATGEWPFDAIRFCEQHLLFQTVSCCVTGFNQQVPEIRIAKKGESDPFVQRLINSGLAYIKPCYKMNRLELNTTHLVKISFIESSRKFFVQLAAAELELQKLMDKIKSHTTKETLPLLKSPAVNTPCLAQFSSKQLYYRAAITHLAHGGCSVLFVDYGCTEAKDVEELRAIPNPYLNLQAQAICCTLKPGDVESEECFTAAKYGLLNCHVLGHTNDSYIVNLTTHTPDVGPRQAPKMMAPSVMVFLQLTLKVNTTYDVTVSYTNDVTEFYCQLVPFKEQLDSISAKLNTRCEFEPISLQECAPNLPVCVKFSEDLNWYRARINKVNHEHDIEVFFVDFGNYDNADIRDIRRMKPELMSLPMQAHKCCLFEVDPPTESSLKDDMFDQFEELTTGQVLGAFTHTVVDGQSHAVTLYERNSSSSLSINEKLLSKFSSISPIAVSDVENLYITSFTAPDSFFAQFEKLSSSKLDEMQNAINEFYATARNSSYKPKVGSYVCAKYALDEQFYRARVESMNGMQCEVLFIDYGNREPIPLNDIHPMNKMFTGYPQFGIDCGLDSFPPATPIDKLKSLMLENSVQAKMIKEDNRKWSISLTEDFNGNVAILELLRQHEMVIPRSIHGAGLQGFQDTSFKRASSYTTNETLRERSADYQSMQPSNHIEQQRNGSYSNRFETPSSHKESSNPRQYTKSFDVISIPLKAFRNVYVSHVVDPSEFYCQIEEESAKLQAVMTTIEETYANINENDLKLNNLTVDSPCCAVFEGDGSWYRGQIKQVSPQACLVYFIDYGNSNAVPTAKVKELRRDFFSLPPQAVKCKSHNVSPKGGKWSDGDIDRFIDRTLEKSFVAQFVECDSKGFYAVNLVPIEKLQEEILNKEFENLVHGRSESSSKSLVPNTTAATINLLFQEPIIKLGMREAVTVSYGLNPGEVFCQLKSSEGQFKKMMMDLQAYCGKTSPTPVDHPQQRMICLAQFSMDSAWYRGEIRKVSAHSLTVSYVDYGNCETVDKNKICSITEDFVALPIQAIKCRLKGIKPPGQSWSVNQNVGKYFEGNVQCHFIEKDNGFYVVDIECNGRNVAQQLVKDRLAISDGSMKVENTFQEPPQRASTSNNSYSRETTFEKPRVVQSVPEVVHALSKRDDALVLGQLLSVIVTYVKNPAQFWCQLLDESEKLEQLMADIEGKYLESNNTLNDKSLAVGSYCMAKYSADEAWYRAQIKSCSSANVYEVFFIDYGNSEVTASSQLAAIQPEFLKLPPQCFECQLHRSSPSCDPTKTDEFNNLILEVEELTAKVERIVSGIPIITLLLEKEENEVNISDLLFGEASDEVSSLPVGVPKFPHPEIPLGLQEGYVTEVNTPHDFYIQLAGIEDNLALLSTELSERCEGQDVPSADNPTVGSACAAKYSEDNNWYRAEIIAVQGATADVLFVDYGNMNSVSIDTLKAVDQKFLEVPPYSLKCKLNGITSTNEQWNNSSVDAFRDMVLDCALGITFISKDIPAIVNITKDDKDVGQSLVDQELALVATCPEADEAYADDHLTAVEDQLHSLPSDLNYPKRKLVSTKLSVKICYADSHNKFYTMPVELSTELDTVMKTLEILYASPSDDANKSASDALEDISPTMACIAKYSEDEAFYRAVITSIEGNNIHVSFVDYGNSEVTTLENLRPITPELIKIPPIAVQCNLSGVQAVEGKEQEIKEKFEEYCMDEIEMEMEVLNSSEPYMVKLCQEEDLADIFCRDGLGIKVTPPPEAVDDLNVESINENVKENLQTAFVELSEDIDANVQSSSLAIGDDTPFSVKYCEIENGVVVIHAVPVERDDTLATFVDRLQTTYNEIEKRLDSIEIMDLCAAKYIEDESWYRAQVLELCDSDKIKVNFIDYGNTETVALENVSQLLPEFLDKPKFSVKFYLGGCNVRKDKNEELQAKLDEILYDDRVFFKICKYSHWVPNTCVTDVKCGEVSLVDTLVNDKLLSMHYTSNPNLRESFKAAIESTIGNVFYILPVQFIEERDKLQAHLQEVCCDISASTVDVGCLYAARVNELWSRVQITVVNSDNDSALVLCVDYGMENEVKLSELALLPSDVCHSPLLLHPCELANFEDTPSIVRNKEMDQIKECVFRCEIQKTEITSHLLQIKLFEDLPATCDVEENESRLQEDVHVEVAPEEINLDVDSVDTISKSKDSVAAEASETLEEVQSSQTLDDDTLEEEIAPDSSPNKQEAVDDLKRELLSLNYKNRETITNASNLVCDSELIAEKQESGLEHSDDEQLVIADTNKETAQDSISGVDIKEQESKYLEISDNEDEDHLADANVDAFEEEESSHKLTNELKESMDYDIEKSQSGQEKTEIEQSVVLTDASKGVLDAPEGKTDVSERITESLEGITESSEGITESSEGITESSEGITESTKGITDIHPKQSYANVAARASDKVISPNSELNETADNELEVYTNNEIEKSQSDQEERIKELPEAQFEDEHSLDEASECITSVPKPSFKETVIEEDNKHSYAQALCQESEDIEEASSMLMANNVGEESIASDTNTMPEVSAEEIKAHKSLENDVSDRYETESKAVCNKLLTDNYEVLDMDIEAPGEEPEDESSSLLPEDARQNNDALDTYLSDSESLEDAKNEPESETFENEMKTESDVCAESDLVLATQEGVEAMQELVLDECHDARPECDIKQDLEDEPANLSNTEEELEEPNFELQRTESSSENVEEYCNEANGYEGVEETGKEVVTEQQQDQRSMQSNLLDELMSSTWQHSQGRLKVHVSDVAIESGKVLFTIKPSPEELSLALFNASRGKYSENAPGLSDSSELNLCAVHLSNEWHRAKIIDSTENTLTVLLIDSNKTESVDISAAKDIEEAHRPRQLSVKCQLASAFCPPEKISDTLDFLPPIIKSSDKNISMKLVQSGDPFKINLIVDGSNILYKLLSQKLVIQKLPNSSVQPGKHSAKMSQIVPKSGHLDMYVNLVSQLDDMQKLKSSMTKTYPLSEKAAVVESSVYAILCDDTWCRGMAVSTSEGLQMLLVDSGKMIPLDASVYHLLPQHCVQPPFAISCQIDENCPCDVKNIEAVHQVLVEDFLVDVQVDSPSLKVTATVTDEGLVQRIRNAENDKK